MSYVSSLCLCCLCCLCFFVTPERLSIRASLLILFRFQETVTFPDIITSVVSASKKKLDNSRPVQHVSWTIRVPSLPVKHGQPVPLCAHGGIACPPLHAQEVSQMGGCCEKCGALACFASLVPIPVPPEYLLLVLERCLWNSSSVCLCPCIGLTGIGADSPWLDVYDSADGKHVPFRIWRLHVQELGSWRSASVRVCLSNSHCRVWWKECHGPQARTA